MNHNNGDNADEMWLVVRALKEKSQKLDYQLLKYDIIKLGRVKFRIKDFSGEGSTIDKENISEGDRHEDLRHLDDFVLNPDQDAVVETSCRFCWNSYAPPENPLLGACRCQGSVNYLHF